ncbi:hypothetical protein [Paraglaciecola polaris]|uniref:Prephenate dehydrogenase n=1 Tax=Paraglaciecola polaris LMG 21857 TaxID=1129793 RepID=K6ZQE3_9ALTE|nr:hypothetical protein [Paraglaciecola polaris]GAC32502.1 hypothetical protein GPLA_1588 [Paraglaciecola polaris LMG 21857]|tara:strand:- start:245 stop:556 length:312 start_codon:yes stop_codon:yes gene_type:complete
MQTIIEKLTEHAQLIYRKSIDADDIIAKLQSSGKGKFQAIFPEDSGFTATGRFFKPYVEELAQDIANLSQLDTEQQKQALPSVVKKIELLLTTLNQFQFSVKD